MQPNENVNPAGSSDRDSQPQSETDFDRLLTRAKSMLRSRDISLAKALFDEFAVHIFHKLKPYAMRLAPLVAGSGHGFEDLLQLALLRAWRRLETFRPTAFASRRKFALAWMKTIMRNIAFDLSRRRQNRFWQATVPLESAAEPSAPCAGPAPEDDWSEKLCRLKPPHRQVVIHRLIENRTGKETAELLGIRPGTVASRLHTALQKLRAPVGSAVRTTKGIP